MTEYGHVLVVGYDVGYPLGWVELVYISRYQSKSIFLIQGYTKDIFIHKKLCLCWLQQSFDPPMSASIDFIMASQSEYSFLAFKMQGKARGYVHRM